MNIKFEVEENDAVVARAERELLDGGAVLGVFASVATELGTDSGSLLKELGLRDDEASLREFADRAAEEGRGVKVHRVCIDLHFETESEMHRFLSRQTWGDVHRFGCQHFHVAADACANLELRDGSPTGPALNDRTEIGNFSGCKTVWMVKPGPETNGGANGVD